MGMLYRRKKKDPKTGKLVETGPWWMKYYDGGRPVQQSTEKMEKREAQAVLTKAKAKVLDGQREGPKINRTKFDDLVPLLKREYEIKGRENVERDGSSMWPICVRCSAAPKSNRLLATDSKGMSPSDSAKD